VLGSLEEPLGVAIMEAMAMRVPVVVTGAGGVPELVDDGVDGLLVPAREPGRMADSLLRLLRDPGSRPRLSESGRRKIETSFHSGVKRGGPASMHGRERLMNVLVSGGAGYIGSVTAEVLLRNGHRVVVLDSLIHGHRPPCPRGRSSSRPISRTPPPRARRWVVSGPTRSCTSPATSWSASRWRSRSSTSARIIAMGLHLLEAGLDAGVRRFILSSTANLFDKPVKVPIDESAALIPGSPYGESKLFLERTLGWLEKTHGLRSACLRYFNAAGRPRSAGKTTIPRPI
jgi:hypothetical protein